MKRDVKKTEKNAGGFILVLVLFTLLILSTLTIGLLNLTAIDANLARNYMYSLQAYYIAEAGIADALGSIRTSGASDNTWTSTFPTSTSNTYGVEIVTGSPTTITSTGNVTNANFSRTLEAQVDVTGGGFGGGSVSGGAGLELQGPADSSGTSDFTLTATQESRTITVGIAPSP